MKKLVLMTLILVTVLFTFTGCSSKAEKKMKAELEEREEELSQKEEDLASKETELEEKESELNNKEKELDQKEKELANKEEELTQKETELSKIAEAQEQDSQNEETNEKDLEDLLEQDRKATEEKYKNERDQLREKLDLSKSWVAVEKYGKQFFPYGFTVHYILGVITEEPYDEDTWVLKAECTIKNQYGQKYRGVCEAKVTGTTDNIKVYDFYAN